MGRNEIRLRRERMSAGYIARHRNYSELMRMHDRDMRLKRVLRAFTYFLVILFLLIILLIIWRWEKRQQKNNSNHADSGLNETRKVTKGSNLLHLKASGNRYASTTG